MAFCLPKNEVSKFLDALRTGKIDPEKLVDMTSAERHTFFEGIVGKDNAKGVNALLESKLLLKNQQQGLITWAKTVAGMKPSVKRDLISRIEKMDTVLDAKTEAEFLSDLAAQKLGVGVTLEEARVITELTNLMKAARDAKDAGGDRLDYGRKYVALGSYVTDLKKGANRLTFEDLKANPGRSVLRMVGGVPGQMKAIQASMDNSSIFRQGWKVLWTNPAIWSKNAIKSFKDLFTLYGQDRVMNELNADIVSRPNYDRMRKGKLDVGTIEEDFPTTLPESLKAGLDRLAGDSKAANVAVEPLRFPIRLYQGSQNAFTAFVQRTRADVFDQMIKAAEKSGVDIDSAPELINIARMVNSLTGRGRLHNLERAGSAINSVLFSPRLLKSHIDTLGGHIITGGASSKGIRKGEEQGSKFVRKQAAKNLIKQIAGATTVLMIARALAPDSVELDPRSSDFGKIRVGNTRFEVFGGQSGILTLAARILALSTKRGGKVVPLNERDQNGKLKFGVDTALDMVENFFENKLSPIAGVGRDYLKGETFDNKPFSVGQSAKDAFKPIAVKNYEELQNDPDAADTLTAMILDGLGVASNTYGRPKFSEPETKNREEFKDILRKKLAEGAITRTQAQSQLDKFDDNALVEKVRNTEDPDKIEAYLKVMSNPVDAKEAAMSAFGKTAIRRILLQKIQRLEKEGSPKSMGEAKKIRELGVKYFPKRDKWEGQRESENIEDLR